MGCEFTAWAYEQPCDQTGGVEMIYVGAHTGTADTTFQTLTIQDGEVSAITLQATTYIEPWSVEMETANFTQSSAGERATSSSSVTQTGVTTLIGYDDDMSKNLSELIKAKTFVIAKDNMGIFRLYFHKYGAKAQIEEGTGTAMEDMNGSTVTFTSKDKDFAPVIASALVEALLPTPPSP